MSGSLACSYDAMKRIIWSSGTTFRYLRQQAKLERFGSRPQLIVVPASLLATLARILLIPERFLLATTYHAELAHLYGSPHPHGRLLSTQFSFHLSVQHVWQTLAFSNGPSCGLICTLVHSITLSEIPANAGWHSGHFQGGRCRLPALHAGWIGGPCRNVRPLELARNENVSSAYSTTIFWMRELPDAWNMLWRSDGGMKRK